MATRPRPSLARFQGSTLRWVTCYPFNERRGLDPHLHDSIPAVSAIRLRIIWGCALAQSLPSLDGVRYRIAAIIAATITMPVICDAQTTMTTTDTYPRFESAVEVKAPPAVAAPLSRQERIEWIVDGVAGPRTVGSA